jgi:shikimate kinase / 3-dehydroquinate synthase
MISQHLPGSLNLFFIYGPPGAGKSSAGRLLAQALDVPFWDLDAEIEARNRASIPHIFARYGEAGFRKRERKVLETLVSHPKGVISLGGGALLNPTSRSLVESRGPVICLDAPLDSLLNRLESTDQERPLLTGDLRERLENLLSARASHYEDFPIRLNTDGISSAEIAWQAQVRLGAFHVRGMGAGYDVRIKTRCLDLLGEALQGRGLGNPVVVVTDENIAPLHAGRALAALKSAGYFAHLTVIPPGESHKTLETVAAIWESFTQARLERGSTVIALGGGVVNDLVGFAAATYLRGVPWVTVPTSLLAMADASLGGKTGFDLQWGKNLVGAFYSPRLVLADPLILNTLPEAELCSGMAEVVKHGVISDPELFSLCASGWEAVRNNLDEIVRRAMAVKVRVIQVDPYEQGARAALNLGHTLGHALEQASDYHLRHGEAVSIGIVAAARLAEQTEVAETGLADEIAEVLERLGLPVEIPIDLDAGLVKAAMGLDKKRAGGKVRFVLPRRIGEVQTGVDIDEFWQVLNSRQREDE